MYLLWMEQITDQKEDLFTLINSKQPKLALSDQLIQYCHQEFAVENFGEFVLKFPAKLYMYMDSTAGEIEISRHREDISSECMESISLYETNGYFIQIDQWMRQLHQGRAIALNTSEKRDWFWQNMQIFHHDFSKERERVFDRMTCSQWNERSIQDFLKRYDQGIYLLRRYVWIGNLILEGKQILPLLSHCYQGEYRSIAKSSGFYVKRRKMEEIKYIKQLLLDELAKGSYKHKELLYWNVMMELESDQILKDSLFQNRYQLLCAYYEKVMYLFWECATPMLHTMFHVKRVLEQGQKIWFANTEGIASSKDQSALDIFLETVNTKLDQTYSVDDIYFGMKKDQVQYKSPSRVRFLGNEPGNEKTMMVDKNQVLEDIYEFLSRDE